MIEKLKENKWIINWSIFAILVVLFVLTAIYYEHKSWIGNVLQTIGTVIGIYLTIILFLFSKEDSDKQFREQLEHLQKLNAKQIETLQTSTEKQISALKAETEKQITTLHELTEKQIEALHKTTFEQISAFEKQTKEVTDRLSDNSILLAEILGRELENSIGIFNNAFQQEEAKYKDLSGWKLFRTESEKRQQLQNSWNKIQQIKNGLEYLVSKYNQVKEFLGFGQKKLNK